jgi:hypothetical protein
MKRFGSARAAAMDLGIPVSTYAAHERAQSPGGRDYGPEEAQRYAQRFGVTPEWLLTAHLGRRETSPTKLKITGYTGLDLQVHFYAMAPEFLPEIEAPKLANAATVALQIRGDSLGIFFARHWYLLYDDLRQPATPDLIGELCVVALKDGQVVVKKLQQGEIQGQLDLIPHAGPIIRDARIVWAANVKGMIQR